MQLTYVFSELRNGLRRNISMTLAAIVTIFVSLTLVGMGLLERINRKGTTVVMATHDNNIVDAMRRRVIELELGHVVRDQNRGVYGVGR